MRLLPLVPVPLVLLLLLIFRPGLLRAGADSPKAAGVGVTVAVVGLVVLAVVRRRSWAAGLWTSSAVVLALMAVVLWPAFRERTVNEAFPAVVPTPVAAKFTATAPVVSPSAASRAPSPKPVAPVVAPASTGAVREVGGRWHGIHHDASGGAALYEVDGRFVLRFEDIHFQGTPGPSVHLISAGKRTPGGGIRLGSLKGERGSFSYPVPGGFDLSRGWSALVWCDTYDTPIAAADLS
jgi:hypothetical protein